MVVLLYIRAQVHGWSTNMLGIKHLHFLTLLNANKPLYFLPKYTAITFLLPLDIIRVAVTKEKEKKDGCWGKLFIFPMLVIICPLNANTKTKS